MSEMVERVAGAIYGSGYPRKPKWEDCDGPTRSMYLAEARAAIAAMREPTRAMLASADEFVGPIESYRLMIDVAIKG